jgi:integrase
MAVRQRGTYKDGKPRWICQWVDSAGEDHIKTFRTKGEAKDHEAEVRGAKKAGTHVPDSKSETVAKAAAMWISAVAAGRKDRGPAEASTLRQCHYHVDKYIRPTLGPVKLSKLTKATVIGFKDDLLKTVSRPLAKKVLSSLKGILNEAIHRERLAVNVAASIHIGTGGRHKKEVVIPTKANIAALLAKLDEMTSHKSPGSRQARWRRRRAMITLAVDTGIRASELRGLPWSSVDLKNGEVKITQRADENGGIGSPKSKSAKRIIKVPSSLLAILREWRMECPHGDLVFPTRSGEPESLANIYNRCWKPLLKAARMPGKFNFHALRHFHASMLIEDGASPKEVMVELGHGSIQMTFDLYGHLFTDEDSERRRSERADRLAEKIRQNYDRMG